MKYKLLIFLFFILSCSPHLKTLNQKEPYSSKGIAYMYYDIDFNNESIKGQMYSTGLQMSQEI